MLNSSATLQHMNSGRDSLWLISHSSEKTTYPFGSAGQGAKQSLQEGPWAGRRTVWHGAASAAPQRAGQGTVTHQWSLKSFLFGALHHPRQDLCSTTVTPAKGNITLLSVTSIRTLLLLKPGFALRGCSKLINTPFHSAFPSKFIYLLPITLPHSLLVKSLFSSYEILREVT